jgi:energy-coupling factor transporter ATP-binding protein EcfA2
MKLATVRITNFKSIEDSESFEIGQTTCLVGKNEAGKTAILTALYRLHPYTSADGSYDRDRDYPRRNLVDFPTLHPDGKARVIVTDWNLEDSDRELLAAVLGPTTAAQLKTLTVSKGYGEDTQTWDFHGFPPELETVRYVVSSSSLHDEEKNQLTGATTIVKLQAAVAALPASDRTAALTERLSKQFARGTAIRAAINALSLPRFLYFSQYQRMPGEVPLTDLQRKQGADQLTDGDRTFLAFCDFAGAPLDQVATLNKFEAMNSRFEGASAKITEQIFKYWSQNRFLRVEFRRTAAEPGDAAPFNVGYIFRTRILNTLHAATVSFDDRSAGFVWFFSFLVVFNQMKKTHGNNVILLLDEPGVSLHAKAQADLLRYFKEKLAPDHQLIYTTHSPFMVPPDDLPSVRTVEDVIVEKPGEVPEVFGTKVRADVLEADRDTLFPLQTALGYEITQSLFIGKNTLVVEGPSDLLYLKTYSEQLRQAGKKGLDPAWTIAPVGGIDKVSAFMSLFGANHLNVAVLVDAASGQKNKVKSLEQQAAVMKRCHVFKIGPYVGRDDADVEDMIGAQGYVDLVNAYYNLAAADKVNLPAGSPPTRVVKFIEEQLRVHPKGIDFDHFAPAEHLMTHRTSLLTQLSDSANALAAFEKLFADVNAALPK